MNAYRIILCFDWGYCREYGEITRHARTMKEARYRAAQAARHYQGIADEARVTIAGIELWEV